MPESEEIFVGRETEIKYVLQILKEHSSASAIIGESGIGKSSFLKELEATLRSQEKYEKYALGPYEDKYIVGLYRVSFATDIANPFVGALQQLIHDLASRNETRVKTTLKRIADVCGVLSRKCLTLLRLNTTVRVESVWIEI